METMQQQVASLRESLTTQQARMKELDEAVDKDGLTDEVRKEISDLSGAIADTNTRIALKEGQLDMASRATPVPNNAGQQSPRHSWGKEIELPPGTRFARTVIAKAIGRGSRSDAIVVAQQRWPNTPEVAQYLKDVDPGTGLSGNWAEKFNVVTTIDSEFIELLRPATILGRVPGFRPAMFNTQMVVQTGGSTVEWVGNAKAKPVGQLTLDMVTIEIAKCAGIVVLSEEQIMTSHPNSEQAVRGDLVAQVSQFLDEQFTDPSVGSSADNPASITNTAVAIPSTGTDANALRADILTALSAMTAVNIGLQGLTMITTTAVAMGIAMLTNALGQVEFPSMTMTGGTLLGIPVVVSDNVPTGLIILVKPSEVFVADEGRVRVDASREATLDMGGGDSPDFSLWQKNCVGLRAERFISWKPRRTEAVQYISGAAYGPEAAS